MIELATSAAGNMRQHTVKYLPTELVLVQTRIEISAQKTAALRLTFGNRGA